ncbi:MAG: hypothetical protein AABX30_01695 [Nanoarchaeota archaeon]
MKKEISKTEAKENIEKFFYDIKNKKPKEIKKMKRLGMRYNIQLKDKRKLFCKNCYSPFQGKEKIRIKKETKSITCESCGHVSRWKVK